MGANTSYNKVLMYPEDKDKTTFITDKASHCYKLSDALQHIINKAFKYQSKLNVSLDWRHDCQDPGWGQSPSAVVRNDPTVMGI